jgi:undecaprenyl-phosphate 4-deoxy-4-formamido-L-arabinose transferase
MSEHSLSVVIPVFNSEPILPELLERLQAVLVQIGWPYEIILVNDGSRDGSWQVVQELARHWPHVLGIELMRNFGQHNALLCGIRAARHSILVTMDDDLQHLPEELPRLLTKLAEGHDVIYGTPDREQHGLWRNLASRLTKFAMQRAMGVKGGLQISALRVFHAQLREAFQNYRGAHVSIDVLLSWATTRFAAITVSQQPRLVGKSNYTLRKLISHAVNLITGFSTIPLQLASMLGFTFTLLGIVVLTYAAGRTILEGDAVPGFPFLASIIAIFSGVQLFALGVIGEYLARMYRRTLDQPSYAIRRDTAQSEPAAAGLPNVRPIQPLGFRRRLDTVTESQAEG